MKLLPLVLFSLLTFSSFAQRYPAFYVDYIKATVLLKDSTKETGMVFWNGTPNQKLSFRESEMAPLKKFALKDVAAFYTERENRKYVSLSGFEAYAGNFMLLGIPSKIKYSFGEQLDSGRFNIYLVVIEEYTSHGEMMSYPNIVFQNTTDNTMELVAYPFDIRLMNNKYEKTKEKLYTLFKDYPNIVTAIKSYNQQDNFSAIIDMVKAVNRQ